MGMTYEQFWHDDPWIAKYIREAFKESEKRKRDHDNYLCFVQGSYFNDALICVTPLLHAFRKNNAKPVPYHKEPYRLNVETEEENAEKEELEMLKMKAAFESLAARINVTMAKNNAPPIE